MVLANNVGFNLGPDSSRRWRGGFQFHFHIPNQVLRFHTPSDNGKHGLLGQNKIYYTVVKFPKFPCNVFKANKTFSENKFKRYETEKDNVQKKATR